MQDFALKMHFYVVKHMFRCCVIRKKVVTLRQITKTLY